MPFALAVLCAVTAVWIPAGVAIMLPGEHSLNLFGRFPQVGLPVVPLLTFLLVLPLVAGALAWLFTRSKVQMTRRLVD